MLLFVFQQLAQQQQQQQHQQLQQQQQDLIPTSVIEHQDIIMHNSDIVSLTSANISATTTAGIVEGECLTTEVNTSVIDTVTATMHDHGDGPNAFTAE